ncbi:hypothetical protein PEC302107_01940 [Pectobacterium araliae]|nr:hypothetical protein PEC302107_01940 [Pectobacterium carotovorum subsp. carotovorum]
MVCFFMNILNIGEYDWMLHSGESLCNLPLDDDTKDITAPVLIIFFGAPLLIALIRDVFLKDLFKVAIYFTGLIAVIGYWWWIFWGKYSICI